MNDLIFNTCAFGIAAIVSLALLVHFLKNKRQHKDFLLGIFSFSILFIVSLYGVSICLPDVIEIGNGNAKSKNGQCEIFFLEDIGGRFGTSNLLQVNIENLTLEADLENFPDLEEGIFSCEIKYGEHSESLVDIVIKQE